MNTSVPRLSKDHFIECSQNQLAEQEQNHQTTEIPKEISILLTEAENADVEKALELFNKAIELRPDILDTYASKSFYLFQKGLYKEVIEPIQKVLAKNEYNINAIVILADCLAELGDLKGCLETLEKALQKEPNSMNTHLVNVYGERLLEAGRTQDALNAYTRVLELDPKNRFANGNKGYVLSLQGSSLIDEAMTYYEKQTQNYPDDWVTYMKKAKLFQLKGDKEKAMSYFTVAGAILEKGTLNNNTWKSSEFEIYLNQHEHELVKCMKILLKIPNVKGETEKQKRRGTEIQNQKEDLTMSIVSGYGSKDSNFNNEMLKRMKSLEDKVELIEKDVKKLQAEKNEIVENFKALERENPKLLSYCKAFYWTALELFHIYRGINTGKISVDFNSIETNNPVYDLIQQSVNFIAEIAKTVPIVGTCISDIVSIVGDLGNISKQNQITAINIIIRRHFDLEEEISPSVARLAIALTKAKKKEIINPDLSKKDDSDSIQKRIDWLQNKMERVKERLLPSISLHDPNDLSAALALDDCALVMAYLGDNHLEITNNTNSLDIQITSIVMNNGLNLLLKDKKFKEREDCYFYALLKKISATIFSKKE